MVRLHRTFSIYIVTGETRCAGCLCTCSGWFKQIEPTRTFSNHIIKEIAKCVEFCHKSSGWFDFTEPSLSTSLQGKQGVQGASITLSTPFPLGYYRYVFSFSYSRCSCDLYEYECTRQTPFHLSPFVWQFYREAILF